MKTLIAFEFKKLAGKKTTWIVLAASLAVFILTNVMAVAGSDLFARAQGVRDVYGRYEGHAITKAFLKQAQEDFNAYMAAHEGRFSASTVTTPDGVVNTWYFAAGPGYYEGVRLAFEELSNTCTLEDKQEKALEAQSRLDAGTEKDGRPLTGVMRGYYEYIVRNGAVPTVVHYSGLWSIYLINDNALPGTLALLCMVTMLLGLFNGEVTARLEPVVLTTRARKQVFRAKLLVMASVAAGSSVLFYGLQFILNAMIWGFKGADVPIGSFYFGFPANGNGNIPVSAAFAWGQLAVLLSALCCGAALAWVSARWHKPLSATVAAALVLGGTVGLDAAYRNYAHFIDGLLDTTQGVLDVLYNYPSNILFSGFSAFKATDTISLSVALTVLPALTVLLVLLARRSFLCRRIV